MEQLPVLPVRKQPTDISFFLISEELLTFLEPSLNLQSKTHDTVSRPLGELVIFYKEGTSKHEVPSFYQ